MRHRRDEPSREFILSYLYYNPLTGEFKWLKTRNSIAEKGSVAGYLKPDGYVQIILCGRAFLAHRLAWICIHGAPASEMIDHINGIRNDNRACNLREASKFENSHNKAMNKNNTSGIKGVNWSSSHNKWHARVGVNGKRFTVGYFSDIREAEAKIKEFRRMHHNEFTNHGR
ncbi:HNH endonuclease [Escherichia coli]|nr:zinc-binding loop region of homing endonuclease [Salmonella phage vB_SenS_ST1]